MTSCFLRTHGLIEIAGELVPVAQLPAYEACEGRVDRVHLVPQQKLKRAFPRGLYRATDGERWWRVAKDTMLSNSTLVLSLEELLADERIIEPGCRKHHGLFDIARKLRIPRSALPDGVWEFAEEFDFMWFVDREYPQLERVA